MAHHQARAPPVLTVPELRTIMAPNHVFGPEEWRRYYGVTPTPTQLERVGPFPWGESLLGSPDPFSKHGHPVSETHVAILGLDQIAGQRLTIRELHAQHPDDVPSPRAHARFFTEYSWYLDQAFARERTLGARWYLLPARTPLASCALDRHAQLSALPAGYDLTSTVEQAFKSLALVLLEGIQRATDDWARTTDAIPPRAHSVVKYSSPAGLLIGRSHDSTAGALIGLGVSRALPPDLAPIA